MARRQHTVSPWIQNRCTSMTALSTSRSDAASGTAAQSDAGAEGAARFLLALGAMLGSWLRRRAGARPASLTGMEMSDLPLCPERQISMFPVPRMPARTGPMPAAHRPAHDHPRLRKARHDRCMKPSTTIPSSQETRLRSRFCFCARAWVASRVRKQVSKRTITVHRACVPGL